MADRETPPRRTVAPAVAAAVFVVVATSPVPIAGLVAIIGVGAVIVGLTRGSRGVLLVGVTVQFGSVLVAALGALRLELVLAASLAVLLAWDLGEQAISVAEQLAVAGRGTRPLVVHAAGATLVGTLLFASVYGLYRLAGNGQPVPALALLLGGGVLVIAGMRL
ncbi:hypothetical protein HLRTI_002203 [Halorhabdus tiamatea SARL4B]|uniref:Hypothetical membrane protein n=1 Tax=Halorhabdus tiamatea SARL4B TaxID=1033806 RepID=F7PJI9_9EURY|nr:hypothetical protein [Halorhabdus tiamatea]ERJ05810.1 hypothetical protein HLRTI_002203 [Halorhabdus tiamatea SARL4B]CCQ34255.1 hypothetical membrane protein [Halorhabdus tiamatea SARL4B]